MGVDLVGWGTVLRWVDLKVGCSVEMDKPGGRVGSNFLATTM